MEVAFPQHIQKTLKSLELGANCEQTLLELLPLLSQDTSLLQVFLELGFSLETSSFMAKPSTRDAIALLSHEFATPCVPVTVENYFASASSPVNIDMDLELRQDLKRTFIDNRIDFFASSSDLGLEPLQELSLNSKWDFLTPQPKKDEFATPKPRCKVHASGSTRVSLWETPNSLNSTPYSDSDSEQGTPQKAKGLKYLTSLVKQLVSDHQPTSYKEVAVRLMQDLVQSRGSERVREEKNVRRRVYDAINVLIAAGVLDKDGKNVIWKEKWDAAEVEERRNEVEEAQYIVKAKRAELSEILSKYVAIQHLVHRNKKSLSTSHKVPFPFLMVGTSDSSDNSVSIQANHNSSSIHLKMARHFSMFGDMDVLMKLHSSKPHFGQLAKFLPHRDLSKYLLIDPFYD
jgi:transcription factor Dp-1